MGSQWYLKPGSMVTGRSGGFLHDFRKIHAYTCRNHARGQDRNLITGIWLGSSLQGAKLMEIGRGSIEMET